MMRLKRILALLCILVLTAGSACAQVHFMPLVEQWTMEGCPALQVDLSAEVSMRYPFSEDRSAQLAALTDHMSMRLIHQPGADETVSRMTLMLNGRELIGLTQWQDAGGALVQLSTDDSVGYRGADPLSALLGGETQALSLYGINGTEHAWLTEAYALAEAIPTALAPYCTKESEIKTTIENMGTARLCRDYTVAADQTQGLAALLASACPEGRLRELIGRIAFDGKQTLRIYTSAEQIPLRIEWNGNCAVGGGTVRDVQLIWRLRRDEKAYRDEVTLRSPALEGSDRNSITYELSVIPGKNGAISMDASLSYVEMKNKVKTTTKAALDLKNTVTDGQNHLTGDAEFKQSVDDGKWDLLLLEPDLIFSGTAGEMQVQGTVTVTGKYADSVKDKAVIRLSAAAAQESLWLAPGQVIDVDALGADELSLLQEQVTRETAAVLVKQLLVALGETADYFLLELPPESIEQILDAANE